MSTRDRVLCVSAGMLAPKKVDLPLARQHLYLNYGLLGLASVLHERGLDAHVTHGRFDPPRAFVQRLHDDGALETRHPILLSVPSSFALGWARDFAREIKRRAPRSRVIVGGRWVTADDGQWVRRQIPDADLVVFGTAESRVTSLLDATRWRRLRATDHALSSSPVVTDEIPRLNYALLERREQYHPSIEVARGCGRGCSFCAEADVPLSEMKPAPRVADELSAIAQLYDDGLPWNVYLEASLFRPTRAWIDELAAAFEARSLRLSWRTETRVDSIAPDRIAQLARLGLRVLDLGLESASPRQLVSMRKTNTPDVYLRRASEVLEACAVAGVWAKVNVLLHPGETIASVEETYRWLDRHRACIKGVSVGPTIVYRYGRSTAETVREYERLGARPVDPQALDREGFAHLHLSESMPHAVAVKTAREMSSALMSMRDYFDLKSFSYLPRGITWESAVFHDPRSIGAPIDGACAGAGR